MREFNTREAEGDYSITFETDDRKAFEQVQSLCRLLVDGKDGEAILIEWLKRWFEYQVWRGSSPTDRIYCKASDIIEDWEEEQQARLFEKQITEKCTSAERFAEWEKENGSRKGEEEK